MIPGPDIIITCPYCSAAAKLRTYEPVEPVGAVSWTDGYQEIPDMPRLPNIARCYDCHTLYWVGLAPQVGFMMPGEEPSEEKLGWTELPEVLPAKEEDYFEALEEGLAHGEEQELELRVFAWWRGNDKFRRSDDHVRHSTDSRSVENLRRIVELTEEGDHEIVLFRAEALRQLGRFEDAEETLYSLCSDYALAREKQLDLIRERSRDLDILFA